MSHHGSPCWFELTTAKGRLDAADEFYAHVFDWQIADAGMPGFTYHLANSGGDMVAGLMEPPAEIADAPPMWMVYIAVDDADAAAVRIKALGGSIFREPADIPGTGRFAIASDPQGAAFGILQPEPMESEDAGTQAWNQSKTGHGNWIELMSTDPVKGLEFYAALFGWTASEAMDMGEDGKYQLFRYKDADIGGMMGLGGAPVSCWLPYFGVDDVEQAMTAISENGGKVQHGPMEVPGPAHIVIATDPQGAWFAVVGP